MSNTPRWLHVVTKTVSDNAPSILSGIAVAGVVGTVILAVKATPRAMAEIAGEEMTADDENRVLTVKDRVRVAWRPYLPAALAGTATIACIVGANTLGLKRQAAMLGAYTLVDTAFREYKDKVHEIVGEQKFRRVDDEIQKDKIERTPPSSGQVIITGLGEQLCYDSLTGRYFKSDVETIRKAANEVNAQVLQDMYAAHDEFYALLGLGSTTLGQELGWNIDNRLDLVFTSVLSEGQVPCLAIGYAKLPIFNYDRV